MSGSSLQEIMMLTYWIVLNLTHAMQLITPPHPQLPLHFFSNNLKSILGKDLQYLFIKSFQESSLHTWFSCQQWKFKKLIWHSHVKWPWGQVFDLGRRRVLHFLNSSHNRRWPALTCLSVNCHESETVKEGSDCPPFLKSRWWQF